MDGDTYTNADTIRAGAFARQDYRTIGVRIGEPFHSPVYGQMVDCEASFPEIITGGCGGAKPIAAWPAFAETQTQNCIAHIDAIVTELLRHRERLAGELAQLVESRRAAERGR